jgi:hypothetical protein
LIGIDGLNAHSLNGIARIVQDAGIFGVVATPTLSPARAEASQFEGNNHETKF